MSLAYRIFSEVKMPHAGSGLVSTDIDRTEIHLVAGVRDIHAFSRGREQITVTRVAGRHHAIEHADARRDRGLEIGRRATIR